MNDFQIAVRARDPHRRLRPSSGRPSPAGRAEAHRNGSGCPRRYRACCLRSTCDSAFFFSISSSYSRARSTFMQTSLFLCCDRSFWHCDDDVRRNMRDADGGVGRIHVLAALAGRPVGIDPQILLIDDDFDRVIDFRIDGNRSERSVPALRRIERRNADQAMDAGFGSQHADRRSRR